MFLTYRRLQDVCFVYIYFTVFSLKLNLVLNFLHKKQLSLPRYKQWLCFILLQYSGYFQCFLSYRNDFCNCTPVTRTKRKTTGNLKRKIRLKTQSAQILSATCNKVSIYLQIQIFFLWKTTKCNNYLLSPIRLHFRK